MTRTRPVFSDTWQFLPLITLHLVALLLFLSFILPAGFSLWRALDQQVFFALNGTLAQGGDWALFWAWANTREKDLALAVIMLLFLIFPRLCFHRLQLQQALVGFLALMLLLLPFRYGFYELAKVMDLTGPSPSRVLSPSIMLTELFPHINAKDSAGRSFPGDHATVMLLWFGFLLWNKRSFGTLLAGLLTVLAILPRMVGGAHWFSDVAVGGLVVALPVLAWACYSPLTLWITQKLEKVFLPVFDLFSWIPLLGRLPFFAASHERRRHKAEAQTNPSTP